jgi:hypothetical protein
MPHPHAALAQRNGIYWHPNATPFEQWGDDKEKLRFPRI